MMASGENLHISLEQFILYPNISFPIFFLSSSTSKISFSGSKKTFNFKSIGSNLITFK